MSSNLSFRVLVGPCYNILCTSFLALVLMAVEELVETEFSCPLTSPGLGILYSLAFFFVPAAIMFLVGFMLLPSLPHTFCKGGCLFLLWRTGLAPLLWIIFLVVDGRYFQCLVFCISGGRSPWHLHKNFYQISQLFGLASLALLVLCICIHTNRRKIATEKCRNVKSCFLEMKHLGQLQEEAKRQIMQEAKEQRANTVKRLLSDHLRSITDKDFLDKDTVEVVASVTWEALDHLEKTLYPSEGSGPEANLNVLLPTEGSGLAEGAEHTPLNPSTDTGSWQTAQQTTMYPSEDIVTADRAE